MTKKIKITKEVLESVIEDLIDGNSVHDIRAETGLPEDRCQEILNIFYAISAGKNTYTVNKE